MPQIAKRPPGADSGERLKMSLLGNGDRLKVAPLPAEDKSLRKFGPKIIFRAVTAKGSLPKFGGVDDAVVYGPDVRTPAQQAQDWFIGVSIELRRLYRGAASYTELEQFMREHRHIVKRRFYDGILRDDVLCELIDRWEAGR